MQVEPGLHLYVSFFLILGHASLSPQMGIVQGEPELGFLSNQKVYIIGKVLGQNKAFKSVGCQIFG